MRCFLSLEIPEENKQEIGEVMKEFTSLQAGASFTKINQLHVTMHFFGELSEGVAKEKSSVLSCFSFPKFWVSLPGIGFFPNKNSPRVVFAEAKSGEFEGLHRALSEKLGFEPEEKFRPHVTLARIRNPASNSKLVEFASRKISLQGFEAERVCLKKSVLGPCGAEHEEIACAFLK